MELIERRRALMAAQPRLPWEYQEVEYIASQDISGEGQYINFGFSITYQHGLEIDVEVLKLSTALYQRNQFFGGIVAVNANFSNSFNMFNQYGNKVRYYNKGSAVVVNELASITTDGRTVYRSRNGIVTKDGVLVGQYQQAPDSDTMTLSALKDVNGWGGPIKANLYGAKVWNPEGVLIANFIPCYHKSNLKPGMYDVVGRIFYSNSGTGEFIVGPDVN